MNTVQENLEKDTSLDSIFINDIFKNLQRDSSLSSILKIKDIESNILSNTFIDDTGKLNYENATNTVNNIKKCKELESKKIIKPTCIIKNEIFNLEFEDDMIYITHTKWSLTGMGKTLLEAELDLIEEANLIADVYLNEPLNKLSYESLKLRDFILKVIR
jgi:hypothetical protein